MRKSLKILGHKDIKGEITCGGAKNLVTKIMVASMLSRSKTELLGVPNIVDVLSVMNMMKEIGISVEYDGYKMVIDSTKISHSQIHNDKLGSRISILFLGVLGHFFKEVVVPMPIGCDLGDRTVDMHLEILSRFGFVLTIENNLCTMKRSIDHVKGSSIQLSYPSVGATETAIMLAVLAQGKSTIKGVAIEPEINALILFLQKCGAKIRYVGDRELLIEGVQELRSCRFKIMGDRLEAASWACMACATNGNITVKNIDPQNLTTFFGPYMSIGGGFKIVDEDVISFYRESKELNPIFLETGPYPMFSTDYQPMMATLMMQATGSSIIHETLFTKRLDYLQVLSEFGLNYTLDDLCYGKECRFASKNHVHSAILNGAGSASSKTHVERVRADTIRSGFAYIIAAVHSGKQVEIDNIEFIERGFEDIVGKLRAVGINAEIV